MTADASSRGWWRRLRDRYADRHVDPYTPDERELFREPRREANAVRRRRYRRRQQLVSQRREVQP